jgi:hypothetical protein
VNQLYLDAVRLLLKVAPSVFDSGVFALKGGTAINLFAQDLADTTDLFMKCYLQTN